MIICSCNVLRDKDLQTLARNGVSCEREAYARLGCKPECGRCLRHARHLIKSEIAEQALLTATPAPKRLADQHIRSETVPA